MGRYTQQLQKIGSWRLLEVEHLAYDKLVLNKHARVALVGEVAHVSYLAQMDRLNDDARRAVDETLRKFAESVGVDTQPASD